jgi:clan AA aspartic protease (TIGR02281 family)
MKKLISIGFTLFLLTNLTAQTVVKMEKQNGVYIMPCIVNGLKLNFIFDTGASEVSISLTEAIFMLKNGYLSETDLIGTERYQIANGNVEEGTKIILKIIEIGKLKLFNVKASIIHNLSAPLLLGQSALSKLGKIEFDYDKAILTIRGGPKDSIFNDIGQMTYSENSEGFVSKESIYTGYFKFQTTFNNPPFEIPIRTEPNVNSREVYSCPKNAKVYVIDNNDEIFFKVYVNGYTGYLTSGFLKRKW